MKNILNDETTLHGRLIGIGKIKKDGTEEFKWLKKPIHNTIVNQGIDYLFTMNGTNAVNTNGNYGSAISNASTMFATYWNSDEDSYPFTTGTKTYGCLEYMAYGDDNTPTQTTDIDLGNRISNYSSTKKTGSPLCGTYEVSYGKYKLRMTHLSQTATEDTRVKEIGWYGRYGGTKQSTPTDTFKMFSRVVLDEPYDLDAGEQLMTTYELVLTFNYCEETSIDFFGMTAADGTPLKAQVKRIIHKNTNDSNDYGGNKPTSEKITYNFPMITTYGDSIITGYNNWGNSDYVQRCPKILPLNYRSGPTYYVNTTWTQVRPWFSTTDRDFPAQYANDASLSYDDSSSKPSIIFKNYVQNSFYRDITIIMPQYFPNNTALESYKDIHYINFCGVAYRFGYYTEEENPETHEMEKVWHPQALRKYGNKILKITFRNTLVPSNTTGEVEVNEQTP